MSRHVILTKSYQSLTLLLYNLLKHPTLVSCVPGPLFYSRLCRIFNKKLRIINTRYIDDWALQMNKLQKMIDNDPKLLFVIGNPHYPTGKVYQMKYLKEIIHCLKEFPNIVILCDQTYALDKPKICLSQFLPKQSIIISKIDSDIYSFDFPLQFLAIYQKLLELNHLFGLHIDMPKKTLFDNNNKKDYRSQKELFQTQLKPFRVRISQSTILDPSPYLFIDLTYLQSHLLKIGLHTRFQLENWLEKNYHIRLLRDWVSDTTDFIYITIHLEKENTLNNLILAIKTIIK